jgi:hypothetical protein
VNRFFTPSLDIARGCSQQDGATVHAARVSMTLLRDVFEDKIISKNISPPLSPDLTSLIIICGEAKKGAVYKDNPHTTWTEGSHCKFHHQHPSDKIVVSLKTKYDV